MDIKVLREEKDLLEFKLIGERHTIPQLLKKKLMEESAVKFVSYKLEHPLDSDSLFIVKTSGKSPAKVLQEACSAIEKDLKEFGSKLDKAL